MSRWNIALVVACLVAAGGVFKLKHSVAAMRDQLYRVEADIAEERRLLRTLEADWAHVTRPDRLMEMALDLGMVRASVQHVVKLERIETRAMFEMAKHRYTVPISQDAEGILRAKPPTGLAMGWDDW